MEVREAISRRRSIRTFTDRPVSRETIQSLLEAAVLAPSAKNHQPWRFVVLQGAARSKLARLMEEGAQFVESRGDPSGSSRNSARIVAQAPVTILVLNPAHRHVGSIFDHLTYNAPDILSIGGMVQTMLLAAEDLGLGTLWDLRHPVRLLADPRLARPGRGAGDRGQPRLHRWISRGAAPHRVAGDHGVAGERLDRASAQRVQLGDLLGSQPPSHGAGVLPRLLRILCAGYGKRALADHPVDGDL